MGRLGRTIRSIREAVTMGNIDGNEITAKALVKIGIKPSTASSFLSKHSIQNSDTHYRKYFSRIKNRRGVYRLLPIEGFDYLEYYFKEKCYIQNSPKKTEDFINYCKTMNVKITKNQLEYFEKERLFFPLFRINRPRYDDASDTDYWVYQSASFGDNQSNQLLDWYQSGIILDPSVGLFIPWSNFINDKCEYDREFQVSYYSSFQIEWLKMVIDDLQYHITFHNDTPFLYVCHSIPVIPKHSLNIYLENLNSLCEKIDEVDSLPSPNIDIISKMAKLRDAYIHYRNQLAFLCLIQKVYYPYYRSGANRINITGKSWWNDRTTYDTKFPLERLNLTIENVVNWYYYSSRDARKILGVDRDDWIQLWKNIKWSRKDKLQGEIRYGIDRLQFSVMLKQFIEDHENKEILDIDEIDNISPNSILGYPIEDINRMTQRGIRNRDLTDENTKINYYHNRFKRRYYLSNDFGIQYTPNIIVFVEGETEEQILPLIYNWYRNSPPEAFGISVKNLHGVTQLQSNRLYLEDVKQFFIDIEKFLREKIEDNPELRRNLRSLHRIERLIVSNYHTFIEYNLEQWQIIPFFLADNEGQILDFLKQAELIQYYGTSYNFPDTWMHVWGTEDEQVFKGSNFELCNFSNKEIVQSIMNITSLTFHVKDIEELRRSESGINALDEMVERNKIAIVKDLVNNLITHYKNTKDTKIFKRPIFRVIDKISELADHNEITLPRNRHHENRNREGIMNILNSS